MSKSFTLTPLFILASIIARIHGCPFQLKNSTGGSGSLSTEGLGNITLTCINKLNLDLDILKGDLFKSEDVDDKCLGKCLLQQLDIISESKQFDRDGFFDLLEEQAPKALLIKLTEIVNKCADSTQVDLLQLQAKRGGKVYSPPSSSSSNSNVAGTNNGSGSCKSYHAFLVCFVTNSEKLC